MRIGWAGPHPDMPTGYATQSALLLPRLRALGHDLAVFATAGQESHPTIWNGIPVFGCTPYADYGEDVVLGHVNQFKAEIVFTFLCTWILKHPEKWREFPCVHITPVDIAPMSAADTSVIEASAGTPAAISRFGQQQMTSGGHPGNPRPVFDPLYLPHGVDLAVFQPSASRAAMRADMGYEDRFVVGMNFMNNDGHRKNTIPALRAFAAFHRKHPDTLLALHALNALPGGVFLSRVLKHLGLAGAVTLSPQYELVTGLIRPADLAPWYQTLDVLVNVGNEGFGLPAVEAQACGTPVILGDWSTGPELVGPGWLARGSELFWNETHQADWHYAHEAGIVASLEEAKEEARDRREASRDNAARWEIGKIVSEHWEPALAGLA